MEELDIKGWQVWRVFQGTTGWVGKKGATISVCTVSACTRCCSHRKSHQLYLVPVSSGNTESPCHTFTTRRNRLHALQHTNRLMKLEPGRVKLSAVQKALCVARFKNQQDTTAPHIFCYNFTQLTNSSQPFKWQGKWTLWSQVSTLVMFTSQKQKIRVAVTSSSWWQLKLHEHLIFSMKTSTST